MVDTILFLGTKKPKVLSSTTDWRRLTVYDLILNQYHETSDQLKQVYNDKYAL